MALAHVTAPLGAALINLDRAAATRQGKSVVQSIADAQGWQAPDPDSDRYRMLDAALSFRGAGYSFRGGKGAHDAWSLLRECASRATERDCVDIPRTVPGYAGVSDAAARLAFLQWGLNETKPRHAEPGDVLLFHVPDEPLVGGGVAVPGGVHAGVLTAPGGEFPFAMLPGRSRDRAMMVHAYPGRSVMETCLFAGWESRVVATFSFDTGRKARPFRLAA